MSVARLPVVIVGTGTRATALYGPLLSGPLSDRIELRGVIGRSDGPTRALAAALGVPGSTDLAAAAGWGARGAIVCVSSPENGAVGRAVIDAGLPALLETPLALDPATAADLRDAALRSGLPVAVAEQNPRHLGSRLIIESCRRGVIGEPRVVVTDGAGYRYHALAVARAVLGRPRGRVATGQRVLCDDVDVGRGAGPEEILVGTVRAEGGSLVQFRDAEAAWVRCGPWSRGTGRVLGTRGEFVGGSVVAWDGDRTALGVEPIDRVVGGREVRVGLRLLTSPAIEVFAALPEAGLDDDSQAVAGCVLDWLGRLEGGTDGWSVQDAFADLEWLHGMSRSAVLGGAPITLTA